MKLRSIAAFGVSALIGQTALAQQAPTAPPPPQAAPSPTVPPPPTWGSGIAPAAQPTQAAQPVPAPAQPGQPVPGVQPAPHPVPPPQYPPGMMPPGATQPGGMPPIVMPPGGYPGWGADQAPMAIGPDGRPRLLPLEMKYDPEKGIPPGYRLVERRRTSVAIAGASIFGGLWIASAIAGGIMEDSGRWSGAHGWPMYIPVIGPFITIDSYRTSAGGATPLVFVGLGQATGVAMFIIGMASTEKILKYQFEVGDVAFRPMAGPIENGGFAGLQGSF